MTPRAIARLLALAALAALAGCGDQGPSGSTSETTTTTSTTDTSSGGGGAASTGGEGGAVGGQGGSTTSSTGGSGGTTTTTTTETGGSGPACGAIARRYGSSGAMDVATIAGAIVTDDGGMLVAGEFAGTITVGAKSLVSAGGQDMFVVRLKAGGGVAWVKQFGAIYDDRPKALVATPGGGAVIAGTFDGVVPFGAFTLTSIAGPDGFALRLSAAGDVASVAQLENADARAVALTDAGDALVVGDFTGQMKIANLVLDSPKDDIFVARLDAAGAPLAIKQFPMDAKPGALVLARGAGRTYLAGSFQGTADFGLGALVSAGSKDVFAARLDDDLAAVFAKRFGDDSSQEARAVAVLSDGSAAIAGSFKSALDFDGIALVADTQDDAFVARLDDAGNAVLAERFGDAALQAARAVAIDANDDILVAGGFAGTIVAGAAQITSASGEDAFLLRLDSTGAALKAERWGGAADQRVRAIALDPCGAVVLCGEMTGSITFGADTLDATGAQDAFVARLAP